MTSRAGTSASAAAPAAPRAAAAAPVAAQVMYAPSYFYGNRSSTGTKDDPTATDFLTTCTSFLQAMTHITTDAEKIRFIAANLRGQAANWWSTQTTVHHDDSVLTNLKVFRQKFAKRFWCQKYLAGESCNASANLSQISHQKNGTPFTYWEDLSAQIFRMASLEEQFTNSNMPDDTYCAECPPYIVQDRHLAVRNTAIRIAQQAWLAGLTPGSEWAKAARAAVNNGFSIDRVVEEADQAYRNIMINKGQSKTSQVRAVEEQDDHTEEDNSEVAAFKHNGKGKGKKSKDICAYCKIRGHIESQCRRKKNGIKPPGQKKNTAAPVASSGSDDAFNFKALSERMDRLDKYLAAKGSDSVTAVQQPTTDKAHF